MNDLKEFLEENDNLIVGGAEKIFSERLGLFFWERGGKQFVLNVIGLYREPYCTQIPFLIEKASYSNHQFYGQSFLDCVACLGEERVKELIKELGEK